MTTGRVAVIDVTSDDDAEVVAPREGAVGIAGVTAHHGAPDRTLTIPSACSRALALFVPASQILPEITERLLVPAITRDLRRAFSDP